MSATKSQNLFGLHPSVLNNIRLPHDYKYVCTHPLKMSESRIWRVPVLSAKIIHVLKSRLSRPRHHLIIGPLENVLRTDWQFITIAQYVRLVSIVNRQLLKAANNTKMTPADYCCVPNLTENFRSRSPYFALRKNDAKLAEFRGRLCSLYNDWRRNGLTQFVAESLAVEFDFSPYYSSFLGASGGVLTPPAVRMLSFCQDFNITLHNSVLKIRHALEAHHNSPSPHTEFVRCLRLLQASHPAYFTRYHVPVVRQARFTVRSTVRNLD